METNRPRALTGAIVRVQSLSISATLALVVILGSLVVLFDVVTGPEISFSIFYVAPVAVVAARFGRGAGVTASVLAATAWFIADLLDDREYSQALIPIWNGVVRLGFFAIIAIMTVLLHDVMREQADEARIDPLTGLLNRRGFTERGTIELAHARRRSLPITLAYLDLDGFKRLNDMAGHAAGDALLRQVGALMTTSLREGDAAGRIGGDEFALILPDTAGDGARVVVARVQEALAGAVGGPIRCSFGVVSFEQAPIDIDAALDIADRLMYGVKSTGVGGVHFAEA